MNLSSFEVSADFIAKYDRPGPRYTSYPPAPHFSGNFKQSEWEAVLQNSHQDPSNLSIYFHIPFCPHRCLYCGCNTEIGATAPLVQAYHRAMLTEISWVFPKINPQRLVTQIHFGGGTPNFIPVRLLAELVDQVKQYFPLHPQAEIAIECDPNHLSKDKFLNLCAVGFNRISLGIQDFNLEVLRAVERKFPSIHPREYIQMGKDQGIQGINLDLIYGLPYQTPASFESTLIQTVECQPSRVAIFSYAHVPWLKPHQAILEERQLPIPSQKWEMLAITHRILKSAGYIAIGMDHYALPHDPLAVAMKEGKLHRNFQGYCTRETTGEVIALGASAISQFHEGYAQNLKETKEYIGSIEQGKWPLEKVYFPSEENLFYREVINSLMCRGVLSYTYLSQQFQRPVSELKVLLEPGLTNLQEFITDELVYLTPDGLEVTPKGWMVVRVIAMAFDPLMNEKKAQYSQTV